MMLKKFNKALGRYKKIRSPDIVVRLYEVLGKIGKYLNIIQQQWRNIKYG